MGTNLSQDQRRILCKIITDDTGIVLSPAIKQLVEEQKLDNIHILSELTDDDIEEIEKFVPREYYVDLGTDTNEFHFQEEEKNNII